MNYHDIIALVLRWQQQIVDQLECDDVATYLLEQEKIQACEDIDFAV